MNRATETAAVVQFHDNAVRIHQKSHILLCASLFYFRIPRAYWKERMVQLKELGYNSIDVYFPWNHHEQQEGEWDFAGERDVAAFLTLASESGLWVVARPGPYICSEWDGGALPAYLLPKDGIRLRDNNALFLEYVERWFDRIMPLLRAFQEGEGGSVIGVQLDNELDFYNCSDPKGYISALRDMALARGITVPLFACAGQGGLEQATGWAEGVVPACNVYADDRAPDLEPKVLHYQRVVTGRGYPLLVTETNRSHYFLRRLLACGVKLLGPYLQVSGTDFGFTNATNNWGQPLAFMTSDYDFGGMISPEGWIREDGYEGRLLSRLIQTYGEALSEAEVSGPEDGAWVLEGDKSGVAVPQALRLKNGGYLLCVTNLEDRAKHLTVVQDGRQGPTSGPVELLLPPGRSVMLPVDVPLSLIGGVQGILERASAELYLSSPVTRGIALAFHAAGASELKLRIEEPQHWDAQGATAIYHEGLLIVRTEGLDEASCRIRCADGSVVWMFIHSLNKALYIENIDDKGVAMKEQSPPAPRAAEQATSGWAMAAFKGNCPIPGAGGPTQLTRADYLERADIYRGYAWYEAAVPPGPERTIEGILIRRGSDSVSLYADGEYAGTAIPGGSDAYLALRQPGNVLQLQARVEIWGHSNFDDVLQPALGLRAMKGLQGLTAITQAHVLSGNWSMARTPYRGSLAIPTDAGPRTEWPLVTFGDWTSPDQPALECYRRSFTASADSDSWTLHFPGLLVRARLYVDDRDFGEISPFDPYIDLTEQLSPGRTVELTVVMERARGLSRGQVLMYEGIAAKEWSVSSAGEAQWLKHAESCLEQATPITLPLEQEPGQAAWLYRATSNSQEGKGWRVAVEGSAIKLTVFFAGHIVGRLWLPGASSSSPALRGGDPASFYLPGAWYTESSGQLSILIEAIDQGAPGRLTSVRFQAV